MQDLVFSPGYVISSRDSEDAGLGKIFRKIEDADGSMNLKDAGGKVVTQPTGFFIDSGSKRLVVISSNNNISYYGREKNHVNIGNSPEYIKYLDGFLYVYDADKNIINVYQSIVNEDSKIEITHKGIIDLEHFQIDISDLSGFEGKVTNFLFLSEPKNNSIAIFKINKNTGLLYSDEHPTILNNFIFDEKRSSLPGRIARFDIALNNSTEESFSIVALINQDVVASLTGKIGQNSLEINKLHKFEGEPFLSNIGFNKGEKTFIVTDYNGKLHVFSSFGDYLGSGGKIGISETGNELLYPSIITSNLFTTDAKEMIVVNKWGENTGFKRILPKASLGKIDVLEKYSVLPSKSIENTLLIKFGLTSGYGVEEISLNLNQLPFKKISEGFYASTYLEELDLSNSEDQNLLKNGGNEVQINVKGKHLTPGGFKDFSQSKTYEFYYHASEINLDDQSFLSSTSYEKNILTFYKSVKIKGQKTFLLKDVEVNLKEGSILEISSETPVSFNNVKFKFSCSSLLQLHVAKDTAKVFDQVIFDGLGENHTMVKVNGDFTGGLGQRSSPSSMLEFIDSKFINYTGNGIHIGEGRSTFVNCEFGEVNSHSVGTGAFNAPGTRSDFLGCRFTNNDIGIDAIGAEIYLSTKKGKYKGREVNSSEFIKNRIGYFGYNSYLRSSNTSYVSNTYGAIDIDGHLDFSFKANNIFSENATSILFSHSLILERGYNIFERNTKEIVFLGDKPVYLDLTCNYWNKIIEEELPVIEFTPDMFIFTPFDFSKVNYSPYLDESKNETLKCNKSLSWNDSLNLVNSKKIKKDRHEWINGVNSMDYFSFPDKDKEALKYGFYSMGDSAIVNKFLYKHTLSSFLYNKKNVNNSEYTNLLDEFLDASYYESPYENVLYDKLVFFGIKPSIKVKDKTVESSTSVLSLSIFPNPSSDLITLNVGSNIQDVKDVLFAVFDQRGNVIHKGNIDLTNQIKFKLDVSSLNPGIYHIQIVGGNHKAHSRFVKL